VLADNEGNAGLEAFRATAGPDSRFKSLAYPTGFTNGECA